ncbi:MAG: cysteine--tRNA ligase, partial [Acidobacteriota bacterium]|nr:cysteine--tRNA ligase [Acidobacteriota bacterium]
AQSEGATGKRFSQFWLHNAFIQLTDEKMSKSLGNIYTISDLVERGIHPLSFRYFNFQAHYRTPMTFSWDALLAAQTALTRLWELAADLLQSGTAQDIEGEAQNFQERFHLAINHDLDLPVVLAILHDALGSRLPAAQKLGLLREFDSVLGLDLLPMGGRYSQVGDAEHRLLAERARARSARDFTRSDELRDTLAASGLLVKDTAQGQRWVRSDVLPSPHGSEA